MLSNPMPPNRAKTLAEHRREGTFIPHRHMHLLYDEEHEKMRQEIDARRDQSTSVRLWRATMSDNECVEIVVRLGYDAAAAEVGVSQATLFKRIKESGFQRAVQRRRGRLSAAEVGLLAERIGVSVATVNNMRKDGRLPVGFTEAHVERLRRSRVVRTTRRTRRNSKAEWLYGLAAWKAVRTECLELAGHRCVRCASPNRLVAHHIVEAHLCDDPLYIGNLETLCNRCHGLEHAARRRLCAA